MKKKIIAITSEKGGIGKTTTAFNIAGALTCCFDKEVLCIDLSPQQNLTQAFDYQQDGKPTISELIYSQTLDFPIVSDGKSIIRHSDFGDFIPANKKLLMNLPKLVDDMKVMEKTFSDEVFNGYDYIIIDCQNSIDGYLVPQVLATADYVIAVTECGQSSFFGLDPILNLVRQIKETHNPKLATLGIVINKYSAQTNVCKEVVEALEEGYENLVFKTYIPFRFGQIENALAEHKPCVVAKRNTLAEFYEKLGQEIIERIGG